MIAVVSVRPRSQLNSCP